MKIHRHPGTSPLLVCRPTPKSQSTKATVVHTISLGKKGKGYTLFSAIWNMAASRKSSRTTSESAFLKHAFREVTSGFCKGTVPGAPPLPSPGPLRMLKNNSKETYLVPPEGHISVKNMWTDSQVVQRYRTRGAPFPVHKAPRMPKIGLKKRTWYQARRHVCAKARLRNPDWTTRFVWTFCLSPLFYRKKRSTIHTNRGGFTCGARTVAWTSLMLGQGCFRALFRRTIYFHLKWV